MDDILMSVTDKTNVANSRGTKSTTVCNAKVSIGPFTITVPVRAYATTDKETGDTRIEIGPSLKSASYGETNWSVSEESAEEFSRTIMEHAEVWSSFGFLQQKAIDRLMHEATPGNSAKRIINIPKLVKPTEQPTE